MIMRTIRVHRTGRDISAAILVVCLFVQSLIPVGWMPSDDGHMFEICAAHDFIVDAFEQPHTAATPEDLPSSKEGHHFDNACPFSRPGLWARLDDISGFSLSPVDGRAGTNIVLAFHGITYSVVGGPLGSRAPPFRV